MAINGDCRSSQFDKSCLHVLEDCLDEGRKKWARANPSSAVAEHASKDMTLLELTQDKTSYHLVKEGLQIQVSADGRVLWVKAKSEHLYGPLAVGSPLDSESSPLTVEWAQEAVTSVAKGVKQLW